MQEEVQTRCIATWTTVILTRIWKYQTISWWSWMLQETSFPPFWLLPFGPEQRQHGTALDYARRHRSASFFASSCFLFSWARLQAQIGTVYSQTWRSKPASFAIACFLFSCKIVFIQHPQHVSNLWLGGMRNMMCPPLISSLIPAFFFPPEKKLLVFWQLQP